MTAHDAQTLMALRHYERCFDAADRPCSDMKAANVGEGLFGGGWTSTRRGLDYDYAPLVSMSLGRLRRLGLVRHADGEAFTESYRLWALSDEGRRTADELLGPPPDEATPSTTDTVGS